eukprot:1181961-Prorocentrum_minimum.AAC.2
MIDCRPSGGVFAAGDAGGRHDSRGGADGGAWWVTSLSHPRRDFVTLGRGLRGRFVRLSRSDAVVPNADTALCCNNIKRFKRFLTSFYGSSCNNNGKGALNTPETPLPIDDITSFDASSCANNGKGALNTPDTALCCMSLCMYTCCISAAVRLHLSAESYKVSTADGAKAPKEEGNEAIKTMAKGLKGAFDKGGKGLVTEEEEAKTKVRRCKGSRKRCPTIQRLGLRTDMWRP